ncbi:MAG: PTS sugar transporter subunit IIB [Sebaldella sp.]|nr:PTS sugar transporter subunit IIB [Sebaldella sp.]
MKILTVCGLGMGTSLILKMNIESVMKKNGINANVEHIDVSTAKSTKADVIVTSNELVKNLEGHGAEIIVIKNFFDKEEIEGAFKERKLI